MYDWGRNKRRTASEKEVNTAVKDFGSRRTVRVYVSAVLFLFFGVKTVMFFLCTVECHSIIKPVFLHTFKSYNKEIGKPDESLGRKATGPVKWQPVA